MTLKQARLRRKLTQEQLEALAQVPQSVISRLENDPHANPTLNIDRKLCKALRVKRGTLEYGPSHSEAVSA